MKVLPDSIDRWLPRPLTVLGTDGYGRSEGRAALREFFEVDYRYVIVATLAAREDLMAGFTAERDMGTEGAGAADTAVVT